MQIGVVDYGVGNIANAIRCLEHVATKERIRCVTSAKEIQACDKIILPGVGAFGSAMAHLEERGLQECLREYAKSGRYMLGICLGMQLLLKKSYEFGEHEGLGLIEGEVVRFGSEKSLTWYENVLFENSAMRHRSTTKIDSIHYNQKSPSMIESAMKRELKIPHIGWNKNFLQQSHPLCAHTQESFYLYFVHSYHVCCKRDSIIATCDYGISFPSIIGHENVLGIQPHPERSHLLGFSLIRAFLELS